MPLTSANGSVELCDIQVGLTTAPLQTGTDTGANGGSTTSGGGSTLSGGAIAGIVVGAVAGVAVLAAAGLYVSRHRSCAAGAAGKVAAAKDNGLDAVAVQAPPGDGLPPTDPAWGSGTAAAGPGGAAGHAAAAVAAGGAAKAAAGAAAAAAGAGAVAISQVDATSRSGGSSGLSYGSPASASLANTPDIISANASGGSSSTLQEATDLSKLPPGFNDGQLGELRKRVLGALCASGQPVKRPQATPGTGGHPPTPFSTQPAPCACLQWRHPTSRSSEQLGMGASAKSTLARCDR